MPNERIYTGSRLRAEEMRVSMNYRLVSSDAVAPQSVSHWTTPPPPPAHAGIFGSYSTFNLITEDSRVDEDTHIFNDYDMPS